MSIVIRILETPEAMVAVEELQRLVWPGSETEIVPVHLLVTAAHNGGLTLGAFDGDKMIGFAFGFPGLYNVPDGPRLKHCSHMLAVLPDARDAGIGFALKRAQWQIVRKQGLDRITWTYDPLQSRNAHLNIARLGAVCNTYLREVYGEMRDGLNVGLPSDRFQVDWWINTRRVERRLGKNPRGELELNAFDAANIPRLYPVSGAPDAFIQPPEQFAISGEALLLAEIPADFMRLKAADSALAVAWRLFTRQVFETCFAAGYLVTDFIHEKTGPRSFYALTHGESTLGDFTVNKGK
jgi:predicted GNAT superfamily acetyltransferase